MKTTYISLFLLCLMILSGCSPKGNGPADGSIDQMADDMIQQEINEQENEKEVEVAAPLPTAAEIKASEEARIAGLYSSLVCQVADPAFRDEFWSDEDEIPDEANEQAIYDKFGFMNEEEFTAALTVYAPDPDLHTAIKKYIAERCGDLVSEEQREGLITQLLETYTSESE